MLKTYVLSVLRWESGTEEPDVRVSHRKKETRQTWQDKAKENECFNYGLLPWSKGLALGVWEGQILFVPPLTYPQQAAVFIHPRCNTVGICLVKGICTYWSYINQSLKLEQVPMCTPSLCSEQGEHANTTNLYKICLSSVTCHFQPLLEATASLFLWPLIKPLSQKSSRTLGF